MKSSQSGQWAWKKYGWVVALAACLGAAPSIAYAQAAIAGVVKDASGAVLPGVTVEASSPALIEKTRSAVSDGTGQYRIENLRPGIYTVRFTLSGFSTVSREGVELSGSATISVNADLRVGSLEETVTVTGESPVVDLQSAQRQTVLTNDVIKAIPTAGSYNALLVLVPALLGGQQDVSTGPCNSCTFSAHGTLLSLGGNRANTDGRLLVDGISIAVPQAGGTNYLTDTRNAQEVAFTVSGSMGEVESGGPVMNIIPRSGGNTMSGNGFVSWANGSLQSSNLSDELEGSEHHAQPAHQELRPQRRRRRSASQGSRLVLRHRARPGQLGVHHEHVLQQERRRPDQVAVRAGQVAPGVQRQDVAERQRPHHRAGDAAQQGEHLLGRAERLRQLRERRQLRQRDDLARGQRLRRPDADAVPAGDVDLAGQQQAAARGRLRLLLLPLGRPREGGPQHREPGAHHRAVRRGVSRPTATSPA